LGSIGSQKSSISLQDRDGKHNEVEISLIFPQKAEDDVSNFDWKFTSQSITGVIEDIVSDSNISNPLIVPNFEYSAQHVHN
jgi:hypothetical protein